MHKDTCNRKQGRSTILGRGENLIEVKSDCSPGGSNPHTPALVKNLLGHNSSAPTSGTNEVLNKLLTAVQMCCLQV